MTVTVRPPAEPRSRLVALVRLERTRTVVVLHGDADVFSRSVLSDAMSRVIATRAGDVVVDLAELDFIDSGSVRVLAIAREWLDRDARGLTFRSPSKLAARVLDLWGLADRIESSESGP